MSLEVLNEGIAYAEARGLTEMLDLLIQSTLDALVDTGEHDKALEIAAGMSSRLEAKGDVLTLIVLRAVQARINALRGRAADVDETIEWIESSARETEDPQLVVTGLSSVALVQAGLGHDEAAGALLSEVCTYPSVRDNMDYPMMLPAMVRTALGIGEPSLAETTRSRLRAPLSPCRACPRRCQRCPHRGPWERQAAADAYTDTADRWERLGVVPEQGFALLGQGRCLLALARPTEAARVLQHAREIFERLKATPALAETDALLAAAA